MAGSGRKRSPVEMRGLIPRLALSLAAIFAGLLLLEVALRGHRAMGAVSTSTRAETRPPRQPRVPRHIVLDSPILYGMNPAHPDVNAQGLRGDEVGIPKPGGTLRILVLGDSIAFGVGVSRDDAFPNRLEALLRETSAPVEVIDASVRGYSAYNELQFYLEKGRTFEADIVVVAFCMNDVANPRLHWGYTWTPIQHVPDEAIPNREYDRNHVLPLMRVLKERRQSGSKPLWKRSALYEAIAPRLIRLRRQYGPYPTHLTGEDTLSIEVLLDDKSPEWRWLTSIYDRLRESVEADGAKLLLAILPLAYQLDDGYPFFPQKLLADYCERTGILCVDVLPALKRDGKQNVFMLDRLKGPYDIWHLTERGHEIAAAEIRISLERSGLISN